MSTFAIHQTDLLLQSALLPPRKSTPLSSPSGEVTSSPRAQRLHSLLARFKHPINHSLIQETIDFLKHDGLGVATDVPLDEEERALRIAGIGAVTASLYGQILDMLLRQATESDTEANWWAELEHSRRRLAWYLLETLPLRFKRVLETVYDTFRERGLAATPRAFTPRALRRLFPASSRPSRLAISFFPHLSRHPRIIFGSPFELARQECQSYRQALQDIRDDRAERLGLLVASRPPSLQDVQVLFTFIDTLKRIVNGSNILKAAGQERLLVVSLADINVNELPRNYHLHDVGISKLRRPSRLIRMWPRLLIIPTFTLTFFRLVYGSRNTLREYVTQAIETAAGFWKGYLVQPFRDILDTVRTGGEEGVRIVSQEGVQADMESLERMVLALSKEKYNFSPSELEGLSVQIRRGDLTAVLKVYEEDLKSPLKSVVAGSLIRSLLIQIQKMKVDVDVALSGIDKLLRSQELTFAFVGVAPSLAIVYALFGWARGAWESGYGGGRYGGRRRRESVWLCMRRIERLLVLSSSRSPLPGTESQSLTSLDQGLILLSVAQLRAYAEQHLPTRSRLREEFLVDVSDLEDTNLGRIEKMDVVKRMWRTWGTVLRWSSMGSK